MSSSVLTTVAGNTSTHVTLGRAPASNQPGVITVSTTPANAQGNAQGRAHGELPTTSSQSNVNNGSENEGPNSIWDFISSAQTPEK